MLEAQIYMIDLYNELGKNYSPSVESLKNLQDIYIKIYFQRIKSDDIRNIIDFLNKQNKSNTNNLKTLKTPHFCFLIFLKRTSLDSYEKGGYPHNKIYKITPNDQ